ncbi:uncharacterized protein LOC103493902 [Cucumis melo]|uniref:Uncharacterized protein LOC103493902 n=1 Tax=Cucumis melo TaxID=3656 RepID=A0ABM3L0U6_CUCME|nr:uncharacterized protein LOC103493902 [Cucumis melo]
MGSAQVISCPPTPLALVKAADSRPKSCFLVGPHESVQIHGFSGASSTVDYRIDHNIAFARADRTPLTTVHYHASFSLRRYPNRDRSPSAMANQQNVDSRPWILDVVPFIVVILITAHVLALVYWIYRLVTDNRPQRRKAH